MFGDFWQQFGLNFPFMGADQQGGMFAAFQSPEQGRQEAVGAPKMEGASPERPGPEAARQPAPVLQTGLSALAHPLAPPAPATAPQQPERRGSFALDQAGVMGRG